jgi:hypothetical protein
MADAAPQNSMFPFLLGTGLQGVGNLMQLESSRQATLFNADEVRRQGAEAARLTREEGARVQSAQRVGFAKAGVDIAGTPLAVLAETANIAETNALKIELTTFRQAQQLDKQARGIRTAQVLSAAGTIISLGAGK